MLKNLKLALPLIIATACLPGVTIADSAASSSASGFSWFANAPTPAAIAARAAARQQMVINTSRTWVCSPAGFGKRSTCVSG
jgi:hypothetical protein